jgi:hypothetical protein
VCHAAVLLSCCPFEVATSGCSGSGHADVWSVCNLACVSPSRRANAFQLQRHLSRCGACTTCIVCHVSNVCLTVLGRGVTLLLFSRSSTMIWHMSGWSGVGMLAAFVSFDVFAETSEFFAQAECCSPHMTVLCACWYIVCGCRHAALVAHNACHGSSDNCAYYHLNMHAATCCMRSVVHLGSMACCALAALESSSVIFSTAVLP